MIPDVEQLVGAYLRNRDDVAALVGPLVGTRTPAGTGRPWVRLTQIGDTPAQDSQALHFVGVHLQLDCYGGGDHRTAQEEASVLARTVRAALHELPTEDVDGAVVTAVKFSGLSRVPDNELDPPRERYVLDATVYVHPQEHGS